jgi:hypothetical protein
MPGDHIFRLTNKEIFSLARILIVKNLNASRKIKDLPIRLQIFDSDNILRLKMDKLAEKIIYFNNYYIYRTGIDIRIPDNEFNEININIAEYANVLDDRFNIFINLNTDSLLIPIDGDED